MNYLQQLVRFHHRRKIYPLKKNAGWLYIILLEYANDLFFIPWFTAPNGVLQGQADLSRKQLDDARNELKTKGYIDYKKGTGNQAGRYLLVEFDTQMGTQLDTQEGTQTDTQVEHNRGTLYKHKQNKTKDKSNTNVLPKESPLFSLTLNTGEEYPIYQQDISEWETIYPAVDVKKEFREMMGWIKGNPTKRKTKSGISKFINSWLAKRQNQGGRYGGSEKPVETDKSNEFIIR